MSVHAQWLATVMPLTIQHADKFSADELRYLHGQIGEHAFAYLTETQPEVARAIYSPPTEFGALH